MTALKEIQQQMHALIEGTLSQGEADALTRRITSDPAAARAYADAMLLAERQSDSVAGCERAEETCDREAKAGDRPSMFRRLYRMLGGDS